MKIFIKKHMGMLVYFILFGLLMALFWCGSDQCGFGFGLLTFYIVLPLSALLVSVCYGLRRGWEKWVLVPFFGVMEVLMGSLTFDLANTLSTGNWNEPSWEMAGMSLVPSLVGMLIGTAVYFCRKKSSGN